MEKFCVHNEQSSFGINKLVNAILNSNGHYEELEVKTYNQPSYNSVHVNNEMKKEQTDLTICVNQLREKMNKVNAEYKFMLSDGYIHDVELSVLINRTNELIDNANSLKSLANNKNEIMLLNSIEEIFRNEQKKMIAMQKGIEKKEETRRTL